MPLNHALKVLVLRELIGTEGEVSFTALKTKLKSTSGNTGSALHHLLVDRYIAKVPTVGRITCYKITTRGEQAYKKYLAALW